MATKGKLNKTQEKSAFDLFDEVDNAPKKQPVTVVSNKTGKVAIDKEAAKKLNAEHRSQEVAKAKKEIAEKVAASKKKSIPQVVTEEAVKSKKTTPAPKGKVVAAAEKGKTVVVETKTTKPPQKSKNPATGGKTVAQVKEEFLAKKSGKKTQVVKTDEVDNKEEKRTKREEQKAELEKFNLTMNQKKAKYHTGTKPAPKTVSAEDYKWKPVKEVEGVNVQRNTVFKTVHPLTVYADYPDVVLDPRGTGLELIRVKSLDNICEAYEEMFKISRKEFLKDAKNKKRFPDAPEIEYYSICSDRRFMHATSWGSNSKDLKPADQID